MVSKWCRISSIRSMVCHFLGLDPQFLPFTTIPKKCTQQTSLAVDGCEIRSHEMKPWSKPIGGYLQGNRIIPGFLRWCEIGFVDPQYESHQGVLPCSGNI